MGLALWLLAACALVLFARVLPGIGYSSGRVAEIERAWSEVEGWAATEGTSLRSRGAAGFPVSELAFEVARIRSPSLDGAEDPEDFIEVLELARHWRREVAAELGPGLVDRGTAGEIVESLATRLRSEPSFSTRDRSALAVRLAELAPTGDEFVRYVARQCVRLSAHPGPTFVSSAREDVEQLALKAALSSLVHEIRAVRDDRVGLARLLSAGAGEEILRPGVPTRDGPTVERYFSSRARRILQSAVREHLGVLEQFDRALALLG